MHDGSATIYSRDCGKVFYMVAYSTTTLLVNARCRMFAVFLILTGTKVATAKQQAECTPFWIEPLCACHDFSW